MTWNSIRASARRSGGGSDEPTSLTTSRNEASTPRASLVAVRVSLLPSYVARTSGLPVLSTDTIVGSGSDTPASR